MSKMKNLEDLFEDQLKDLYSAETQLIDAIPAMEKKASNSKLKDALSSHLEETKNQRDRISQICKKLNMDPEGEKCNAIAGIIKEAEKFMKEDAEKDVMDAGIIANGQRVEHYEIAAYGTAHHYARQLGHTDIAELLNKTLEEEKKADSKLNDLAVEKINAEAI